MKCQFEPASALVEAKQPFVDYFTALAYLISLPALVTIALC
jgi:hypothetical protein